MGATSSRSQGSPTQRNKPVFNNRRPVFVEKKDPRPISVTTNSGSTVPTNIAQTSSISPTMENTTVQASAPYLLPESTQPGDLGKKSKKKNRQSTILTSVTGVETPATLGRKTLLG